MVFQLAFSTNAFKRFTLADALKSIAQAGYIGAELLCDVPHAYPPLFDDSEIGRTKKLIADLGLKISNLNAFTLYGVGDVYRPSWIEEGDEKARQVRIKHTIDCIRMAEKIGAKNISTEPGGPAANGGASRRATMERLFVKGIKEAEKAAQEHGVRILVEPEPGLLIENSTQFLNFIKDVHSDLVGLNFDIGHFYCVREDPEKLIYRLADHIGHFHLEDIAADRVHSHLLPGKGAIDFGPILRAIESIGYSGFVTVELYPYQDDPASAARDALEHLDAIIR
ncbi:MAG: sugar phosphate isomerase/epimerase [Nitrososphaera sp.]